MKAGFAEADITPPVGILKIGWLKKIVGERVLDPLYARIAVFDSGSARQAFIQLDLLSIRWSDVERIRRRVSEKHGLPGGNIMVSATHNHAGPAVANAGEVRRDEKYIADLIDRCVSAFGTALRNLQNCRLGFASGTETGLAFNRRMIMRDGTVKTQVPMSPDALCPEGPADPEIGLLAARGMDGEILGCMLNFTCHPCHHGGENVFSSGYPGVLAAVMKRRGVPVALFLNGASGNIIFNDPLHPGVSHNKEVIGSRLADRATMLMSEMKWRDGVTLRSASKTLELPFRAITKDEINGTVRGAQRFIDPKIYDREMPALCEKIKQRGYNKAEVQVLAMDEYAWVGIPAEYFVEHGLRIKEEVYPTRAWIVGHANGMVGYVPTKWAFERGGYETTFAGSSRLAPEAGDMLTDTAIELIKGLK